MIPCSLKYLFNLVAKLFRFGDHERLPHPTDCAYFYACLSSGQPRLLGCERPKVVFIVQGTLYFVNFAADMKCIFFKLRLFFFNETLTVN